MLPIIALRDSGKVVGRCQSPMRAAVVDKAEVFRMFYYGEDYLKVGEKTKPDGDFYPFSDEMNKMRWGNIVASLGWRRRAILCLARDFAV